MTRKKFLRLSGYVTLRAVVREIRSARSLAADWKSFLQLSTDLLLYRALKLGGLGIRDRERTITLSNQLKITYRLNRGDLQSIREVWFDEVYRLPYPAHVKEVVDLGANIGLSSLYFCKMHDVARLVAVEPNAGNASITRRNLANNGIEALVIEAAVGPSDGFAFFSDAVDSNLGAVSQKGRKVRMVTVDTLCSEGGINCIHLMKMDIEGGEQALLTGPLDWLPLVQNIMAEFHPNCVDYPGLVSLLVNNGFDYIEPGSIRPTTCDTFRRQHPRDTAPVLVPSSGLNVR